MGGIDGAITNSSLISYNDSNGTINITGKLAYTLQPNRETIYYMLTVQNNSGTLQYRIYNIASNGATNLSATNITIPSAISNLTYNSSHVTFQRKIGTRLFLSVYNNLLYSDNDGIAWTTTTTTPPLNAANIIGLDSGIYNGSASSVLLMILDDYSLYLSTDNGVTWSNITNHLVYDPSWPTKPTQFIYSAHKSTWYCSLESSTFTTTSQGIPCQMSIGTAGTSWTFSNTSHIYGMFGYVSSPAAPALTVNLRSLGGIFGGGSVSNKNEIGIYIDDTLLNTINLTPNIITSRNQIKIFKDTDSSTYTTLSFVIFINGISTWYRVNINSLTSECTVTSFPSDISSGNIITWDYNNKLFFYNSSTPNAIKNVSQAIYGLSTTNGFDYSTNIGDGYTLQRPVLQMGTTNTVFTAPSSTQSTMIIDTLNGRVGINKSNPTVALDVNGTLNASAKNFCISHPLPAKESSHYLIHSVIEGPYADLLYRGTVTLQDGTATINIDSAFNMTEGTFVALCRNVQCFTTNETDWTTVRGHVVGNVLTVEAQEPTCAATVSWLVIGERQDKHMLASGLTDDSGRVIVEPLQNP